MKHICMIGEGAWGMAVATLLAENGYIVNLWCHDPKIADAIIKTGFNDTYLPGIVLSKNIKPYTDLSKAVCGVDWIFEAIPVKYLRSVLQQIKICFSIDQKWVILSKGIEKDTLLLPSEILDDVFNCEVKKAIFAGPSFAHEVATKQITAVTVASTDCVIGKELQLMVSNNFFRVYVSLDIIGVQIGAALKNVLTLGVGLLDGAGFNDNTKAFFLTRGFNEMIQLAVAMGAKKETLYGLSGFGDLVLTAMGKLSRNLEVGKRLGRGETLDVILNDTGYIPEGINTIVAVFKLMNTYKLQGLLCGSIHDIIFNNKSVKHMLNAVMKTPLTWECE